jgi:anti-sigma factor RsiW
MKTPDQIERITRWLDGALSPAERTAFQQELQADPALRAEVSAMEKLGGLVRAQTSLDRPVPNADFFNSQIQERISESQRAEDRRQHASGGAASWLAWFRAPWAIAGLAALVALGLFVTLRQERLQTQVVSLYLPDPGVRATVNYNAAADATVLTLDGLDAFPDDKPISGLKVHRSDNDPEMASATLYDNEGKVLLVMATDARNRPLLIGRAVE